MWGLLCRSKVAVENARDQRGEEMNGGHIAHVKYTTDGMSVTESGCLKRRWCRNIVLKSRKKRWIVCLLTGE